MKMHRSLLKTDVFLFVKRVSTLKIELLINK